ncbi:MAG: choice-of-anchor B domain-containing protein [Planctomycetota bacterium]|jgi:choice-of-anchor B domain-containing protein
MSIISLPANGWRTLALCLLASPLLAAAHDDDPKILDRERANAGPGFRTSLSSGMAPVPVGQFSSNAGFPASGVSLLSWIPLGQIDGAASGNDCWGYTSPSGNEYAIIGTSDGTAFFDISNPGNPNQVGYISGPNSLWRDIKTYGTHAYIVSEGGGGIQVVNLGNIDAGQVTSAGTVSTGGSTSSHNVAINTDSGFLYRLGGGNNTGLRIYDLNVSPTNPPFVGDWLDRYVHDAQIVSYTSGPFAGKEVAFCCSGFGNGSTSTGLTIVDVTNKNNPVVLDQVFYPNPAYSHQGWLSGDRQRFYLGDELDEDGSLPTTTWVINVADINNAFVETSFTNGNNSIGHNMYEKNGLLYQANYTSGLRIFDIAANPTNPPEVAFFDTRPSDDNDSFNGLWSCYPYFDSGVVIGSDLESGLFIWYAGDPQLDVQIVGGAPDLLDPNGAVLDITITPAGTASVVPGSETLWYDMGAGFVSTPLVSNGGASYDGIFPAIMCSTSVSWYISAESNSGLVWTAPGGAPAAVFTSVTASSLDVLVTYDMQAADGWVGGAAGDNASTGIWERGNPNGTAAQPEDDHSPIGLRCWFTGQANPGDSVGTNDVDGGTTTLLSPVIDLSSLTDPLITYWRWYSNTAGGAPNADIFQIDISDNGGSTWSSVEVVGPSGPGTSGGWIEHSFNVADFVSATGTVQMRFRASDLGTGSIVEAAIDDLRVAGVNCGPPLFTRYCDPAVTNSGLIPGMMDATGSAVVANNNLTVRAYQLPVNQFGIFITSMTQANIPMAGGSIGTLCVGGNIGRFGAQQITSPGEMSLTLNLGNLPLNPNQAAMPGDTFHFQAWYRDLNPTAGSNFTDGISILFQ